jgi:acetylornithine/N-succinyldiaminopimelate aminotransferase
LLNATPVNSYPSNINFVPATGNLRKKFKMLSQRQLFMNHLAQTSENPIGIEVERAEGSYIFSPGGKKYLDLIAGISVSNTGHRHPKVVRAVKDQLDRYMHVMVFGEYIQSPQVKLASKLAGLLPATLSVSYFVNSGSEAVEGAIKLAKRFTGRSKIVAFNNAYHGSTHGSLSLMGNETLKKPFYPLLPGIIHIPINVTDELQKIDGDTACVILEPIQGEAGVIAARHDFLEALRMRCSNTGTLLVFDEIQTGFGRTGRLFAFENPGIAPDILVLAKGLGGGMPIGAFLSSPAIMSCLSHDPALAHITTFGGHPVCCAAALANIEVIIEEKLVQQVEFKSRIFKEQLGNHPAVKELRISGLLIAVDLGSFERVKKVIEYCLDHGVIIDWFLFNPESIRIAPPLTITLEQINEAIKIIINGLDRLD